jgi:hypothetical protein
VSVRQGGGVSEAPRLAHEVHVYKPTTSDVLPNTRVRYGWTGHKPGSGFSDLLQYCITIGSETTFLSALCVIRSPSYFVWSRTFLLGVVLTDLGDFGWYFGQNKEIVSVFNGSVVHFNVGIGLTFLGRCCSTCQNFTSSYFLKMILAVETVEILCPEVNLRPPHKIKLTSGHRISTTSNGQSHFKTIVEVHFLAGTTTPT